MPGGDTRQACPAVMPGAPARRSPNACEWLADGGGHYCGRTMNTFGFFSQLRVVVATDSAAGAYCAKLFADFGAHVVAESTHDPQNPFYYRSVWEPDSPGTLKPPITTSRTNADVVIVAAGTQAPATPTTPAHPGQVVVEITPFGIEGPYARWRSTDLIDAAIAGHLNLTGHPEREPLRGVADLPHHAAGLVGFISGLAALVARVRTGAGQRVEVTHQEVLVALHQFTLLQYTHNGHLLARMGNRLAGSGNAIGGYECQDGWIGLALPQYEQMETMLEVTGLISLLERPDVESIWDIMIDPDILNSALLPYLKEQPRDEIVELFQALRLPCAPTLHPGELLSDPHLNERGFWHLVEGDLHLPGAPIRLSDHAWSLALKPEPPIDWPMSSDHDSASAVAPSSPLVDGPLTGIRVLDLTTVWAGPLAARLLADLGADVTMVEVPWARTPAEVPQVYVDGTHFFPDNEAGENPWNRSGFFNKYAINKKSSVVALNTDDGAELFAALLPSVDVVIENYSPRVMPNLGFDEQRLAACNPSLIYVTMPGYGRSGPYTDWVAYGPTLDGHVGHTWLTGYEGEPPWKCGIAWPDPIAGLHAAAGTLIALLDRLTSTDPTPRGQTVEVPQMEAAINMIGQNLVGIQQGDNHADQRWGNRRPGIAPQGVYRCQGDDRWIAISVPDDDTWRALCHFAGWDNREAVDGQQWVDWDTETRWGAHDEIDDALIALTATWENVALMTALQDCGVPAGAVLDPPGVLSDPQLAERSFFVSIEHPEAGTHPWSRFPATLAETPTAPPRRAPLMGEHNEHVVRDIAGWSAERFAQLEANNTLRSRP